MLCSKTVRKRLYIIAPCRSDEIWRKKRATFVLPQMSLAILAELTPPNFDIKVTDELVDDIDFTYPADLVAITSNTTNAPRAYAVADEFRKRGARIVIGGIHPSTLPEEALGHADSVAVGEAEGIWEKILDDFLTGSMGTVYQGGAYPDAAVMPSGRWDLLNTKRYYVPRTFQTSRGCPHGCGFCSSTQFFGVRHRCRPVGRIVDEMKSYRKQIAVFIDDNIAGNPAYARELFQALIPLRQRWVSQCSIDIARDSELLRLASESGCEGLLIGFESINPANAGDVRKLRKASQYAEAIREIKRHGIGVHGSFIFGFDHDTPEIFDATLRFVMENRLEVANYCALTPFPGTRLFEDLRSQGRITESDWSRYDRRHIVYEPKQISADELLTRTSDVYLETYRMNSILKRMPRKLRNIPPYLAINLSYRLGAKRLRRS